MSKKFIRTISFIILLIIFTDGFSKSHISRNLSNLAYVLALGIETGENAKLKITAQFAKDSAFSPSGSSSDESEQLVLVSGESDSIFSGINLLNSYIGKELNLAHCDLIVFSEELAKNGIADEIYSLINNEEIRPSTNIVVSTCSSYEYLKNVNPNLEKLPTKYYDTFVITSQLTGYTSDITIGDFYNDLSSQTCHPTAILGGLNSTARSEGSDSSSSSSDSNSNTSSNKSSESNSQQSSSEESSSQMEAGDPVINPDDLTAGTSSVVGNRGSENIGMAVFKDDKYCGKLTATESICHMFLLNELDSCTITIDNPLNTSKPIELRLSPSKKTKISVDVKNDKPKISIKISSTADILTIERNINYGSSNILEEISKTAEKYLKDEFDKYLNKVSKEYGTDIDEFGEQALCRFATVSEWESYNWLEKFKDAEFDVSIDVDVISSLLITGI